MKTYLLSAFIIALLGTSEAAIAQNIYTGCPHGAVPTSGKVGYIDWRFKDPTTGVVQNNGMNDPTPDKVYKLEIYTTSNVPAGTSYVNIGVQGQIDSFRIFQSLSDANANNSNYYSAAQISSGIGPDVGADQTAVFYIRTFAASDPQWAGQLTAFKAYGMCYPNTAGYPTELFKKTLLFRP